MKDLVLNAAYGPLKTRLDEPWPLRRAGMASVLASNIARREETRCAHATGALATAYAPAVQGDASPPVAAEDLSLHDVALILVVTLSCNLLVDEGVRSDVAQEIIDSFLELG